MNKMDDEIIKCDCCCNAAQLRAVLKRENGFCDVHDFDIMHLVNLLDVQWKTGFVMAKR